LGYAVNEVEDAANKQGDERGESDVHVGARGGEAVECVWTGKGRSVDAWKGSKSGEKNEGRCIGHKDDVGMRDVRWTSE
jgi:hypothetical protein